MAEQRPPLVRCPRPASSVARHRLLSPTGDFAGPCRDPFLLLARAMQIPECPGVGDVGAVIDAGTWNSSRGSVGPDTHNAKNTGRSAPPPPLPVNVRHGRSCLRSSRRRASNKYVAT